MFDIFKLFFSLLIHYRIINLNLISLTKLDLFSETGSHIVQTCHEVPKQQAMTLNF